MTIAGTCVDIDGDSWHRDGDRCDRCGFGFGAGAWSEPTVELLSGPVTRDRVRGCAGTDVGPSSSHAVDSGMQRLFSSPGGAAC